MELRHGMTPADVQELLGKPRRTALRSSGGSANSPWEGSLLWTYVWNSAGPAYSSSERSLNIEFGAKAAEQWYVNGWSWSNY